MQPPETWQKPGRLIGRRGLHYDCVPSTSSLALEQADDASNDGLVIVARRQTLGRGQHGRTWTAPSDSSLLMSLLVFPPPPLQRPVLMTAWAAVSVCQTIERLTGLVATIKWPNDVLLKGKKVSGILIEQRRGVVIGIGLNLLQTSEAFTAAGLPEATSLLIARRKRIRADVALWTLLDVMERIYEEMHHHTWTELERSWRAGLGLVGERVTAECHSGEVKGVVRKLSFEAVEIDLGEGAISSLQPETIRHLTPFV